MKRVIAVATALFVAFGPVAGVHPAFGQDGDEPPALEDISIERAIAAMLATAGVDRPPDTVLPFYRPVIPGSTPEVFARFQEEPAFTVNRITIAEPLATLAAAIEAGPLSPTLTIRNPLSIEYASTSVVTDGVLITSTQDLFGCGPNEYLEWAIAEIVPGLPAFEAGQVPPFLEGFTGVTSSICRDGSAESFFAQGPNQFENPILTIGIEAESLFGLAFFFPRPADISVAFSGSLLDDVEGAWVHQTPIIPVPVEILSLDDIDELLATTEGADALERITTPPAETSAPPPSEDLPTEDPATEGQPDEGRQDEGQQDEVPAPAENPPVGDLPVEDPVEQPAQTGTDEAAGSELPPEGEDEGGGGGLNPVVIVVPVVVATGAIVGYWVYRRDGSEPEYVAEPPKIDPNDPPDSSGTPIENNEAAMAGALDPRQKRAVKAEYGARWPYDGVQLLVGEAERENAPSNGEGWLAPSAGAVFNADEWPDDRFEPTSPGAWSGLFVNSTTGEILGRGHERWEALRQELGLDAPP